MFRVYRGKQEKIARVTKLLCYFFTFSTCRTSC